MATAKKNESVEDETIVTEEIKQEAAQQDTISDRRMILAPLAKYAVVAVVMASIIVTTAILMNREFNGIDAQMAALEIEIAQQDEALLQTEQDVAEEIAEISVETPVEISNQSPEIIASTDETTEVTTLPEVDLPVAAAPVAPTPVAVVAQTVQAPLDGNKARLAEHHEFMAQQDQKQLALFKANQTRQMDMLREQLGDQQGRIEAMEARYQESYELREAAVKRMQEAREQTLNSI